MLWKSALVVFYSLYRNRVQPAHEGRNVCCAQLFSSYHHSLQLLLMSALTLCEHWDRAGRALLSFSDLHPPTPQRPASGHFRVSKESHRHPRRCVINTHNSKICLLDVNKRRWIVNIFRLAFHWKDYFGGGRFQGGSVAWGLCTHERGG